MASAVRLLAPLLLTGILASGCAVGPDFKPPGAPKTTGYLKEPLPRETASAAVGGGAAQRFVTARHIPAEWWQLFRSPALNALIAEAFKANPDVAAAQAALRQAHELTLAGKGAFFPTVQA